MKLVAVAILYAANVLGGPSVELRRAVERRTAHVLAVITYDKASKTYVLEYP